MAKRGYKLQEFVAHSGNVNCLNIGKKTSRLFVTGGDDQIVNLWSIGKPTSLVSLCGHATPVESVTINPAEVLVLAGASAGAIKLWDLEETKMVRTLPGHRSYCSAVEFHPFGEFFASGSMDTNLKIWDIRKKGCIHTYKGHTRGITNIRFTPDGRWVVSGGLDNVVKIWDLTAGKLLHDFKSHEGHIRSIDFHPLEFLLATGSADRTVKLWDLETFELIGSTKPEATGVRSITFHPDGRTLFCGLDDSFKVVSWEPVVCHDGVDMGWSTLGDLSVHDGKLLGCSYYHDSVAVWAADISLIKPYRTGIVADQIINPEEKHELQEGHLVKQGSRRTTSPEEKHELQEGHLVKQGSHRRTTSSLRCPSPDYDTKEIKNIYVDTAGGKPVNSERMGSYTSPTVVTPSNSNEIRSVPSQKKVSTVVTPFDSNEIESVPSQKKVSTIVTPSHSNEIESVPSQKKVSTIVTPSHSNEIESVPSQKKVSTIVTPSHSNEIVSVPSQKKVSTIVTPSHSNEIESFPSQKKVSTIVTPSHSNEIESVPSQKKVSTIVTPFYSNEIESVPSQKKVSMIVTSSHSNEIESLPSQKKVSTIVTPSLVNEIRSVPSQKKVSAIVTPSESKEIRSVPSLPSRKKVSTAVTPSNSNEIRSTPSRRKVSTVGVQAKATGRTKAKSFVVPALVLRDSPDTNNSTNSRRESITSARAINFMSQNPSSARRQSAVKIDRERLLVPDLSESMNKARYAPVVDNCNDRLVAENNARETSEEKQLNVEIVAPKLERVLSPCTPYSQENSNGVVNSSTETNSVKFVNGVAVVRGRTRSLVERFEKREKPSGDEAQSPEATSPLKTMPEISKAVPIVREEREIGGISTDETTTVGINRNETTTVGINRNETTTIGTNRNETRTIGTNRNETRIIGTNRNETTAGGMNRDETTTIGMNRNETRTIGINRNETTAVGINRDERTAIGIDRDERTTIQACSPMDQASERAEDQCSPMNESHSTSSSDGNLLEDLMRNHDVFLSTLRSRLTKLQVVRHFWVRNDIKGAIEAVRKLPDHSIQAEMISLLIEKMDVLTLDLFSCLLPVLLGLLGSKMERHANISLEMLLKLVAIFGPVVRSTISAAPTVGVDLHKEQRIQCCNQCFIQLQKIQRVLPVLIRRGGLVAKSAMELNMVLQD